ncbi:hypothetical protein PENTCL1PPCAC_91, partial [Pristionchus entomophagus]
MWTKDNLMHSIGALLLEITNLTVERNLDLEVQVALVSCVRRTCEDSLELFTLFDSEGILQIEDGLLPVGILAVRSGGESCPLVALGELDGEVSDERLYVVVAVHAENKFRSPGEVGDLDGVEIDLLHAVVSGYDLVVVHNIDEGLSNCDLADRRHVETVDVVPPVDLILLVLSVLDGGDEQLGLVGEEQTVGCQPLVASVEDSVEHRLVEEAVSHPLRDDDVNLNDFERQLLNVFNLALNNLDDAVKVVVLDDLTGLDGHVRELDGENALRSGLGGEHGENTSSGSDIHDDLVLEEVLVVVDGVAVSVGTDLVLEHLLKNTEVSVGVEVVVLARHLIRSRSVTGGFCCFPRHSES